MDISILTIDTPRYCIIGIGQVGISAINRFNFSNLGVTTEKTQTTSDNHTIIRNRTSKERVITFFIGDVNEYNSCNIAISIHSMIFEKSRFTIASFATDFKDPENIASIRLLQDHIKFVCIDECKIKGHSLLNPVIQFLRYAY